MCNKGTRPYHTYTEILAKMYASIIFKHSDWLCKIFKPITGIAQSYAGSAQLHLHSLFQVHPESGRGVQQSRSRQGTDRSPPNDVRASQPVYQRQKREADLQHRAETPLQGKSKQPNPCFAWDSNLRPQDL